MRSGRKDEEREKKEKGREIARCFCFWPEGQTEFQLFQLFPLDIQYLSSDLFQMPRWNVGRKCVLSCPLDFQVLESRD